MTVRSETSFPSRVFGNSGLYSYLMLNRSCDMSETTTDTTNATNIITEN